MGYDHSQVIAFVDESGDKNWDISKKNVSSHFILAAVIVEGSNVEKIRGGVATIAEKEFQGSEIKSSKVGKNTDRRTKIWKAIMALDIRVVVLLVEKKNLTTEGYRFKKSFFKNLHGKIERQLLRTYPDIEIIADEHGRDEYMESFGKYVKNKYNGQFFKRQTFRFQNSNLDRIIQVADFIAGTVAYAYEREKADKDIRKMVHSESKVRFITFPTVLKPDRTQLIEGDEDYSGLIKELAVHRAKLFIVERQDSTEDAVRDQVSCVEYLLDYFLYVDEEAYVPTEELIDHVSIERNENISKDTLRRTVIGKIRDAGVLLASHAQPSYGYKLPASMKDLGDFLDLYASIVLPMLSRIKIVRDLVSDRSRGKLDIAENSNNTEIKRILDTPGLFDRNYDGQEAEDLSRIDMNEVV